MDRGTMNYKDYREQREIERLKQVKDKPIERDYSHLLGNKNGAKAIAKGEGIEHTVLRKTLNEYRKISIRKQNLMDRVKEDGITSRLVVLIKLYQHCSYHSYRVIFLAHFFHTFCSYYIGNGIIYEYNVISKNIVS